jgi:O-methyltransferase involved in polyketide biosynthesis
MIITEGMLEYLTEEEVKLLFNRLTGYFPHAEIAFDVTSSYAMKSGESSLRETTGAVQRWAVDNPSEIEKLDAKLLRVTELSLFRSRYVKQLPWISRLSYGFIVFIPRFKNMMRLFRYQF